MENQKQYHITIKLCDTYKKKIVFVLSLLLISTCFSGCNPPHTSDNGKPQIIATIFPAYDFAKQICGDYAEVTLLLPPELEVHSYEPSPKDIIRIQNCDLFLYVGGKSDFWVDEILNSIDTPVKAMKMMDCVTLLEEIHEETSEHDEEATEYDEHIWTSPKNAVKIVNTIQDILCQIDKKNKQSYHTNTSSYVKKLTALDKEFTDFFSTVQHKTLIFGDRFPFIYFAATYGLSYYSAFPGCSTETEPSVATITFLINKMKEENIDTIYYTEFSNHKIADSMAEATNAETALLHSCHNVSKSDLDNNITYISLMKQNLNVLKEAMK